MTLPIDTTSEPTLAPAHRVQEIVNPNTPAEMVWVDMETTGLVASAELPLEIGVYVTDRWGRTKARMKSLIMPHNWRATLAEAHPIVKEMHSKNGLADHLSIVNSMMRDWYITLEPERVAEDVRSFLEKYAGSAKLFPMAGSSVHLDRAFMAHWMTTANEWFHYRHIDVSTVMNLCKLLNPPVYASCPQIPDNEKAHRVWEDIDASIRQYKFYKDNFLFEG